MRFFTITKTIAPRMTSIGPMKALRNKWIINGTSSSFAEDNDLEFYCKRNAPLTPSFSPPLALLTLPLQMPTFKFSSLIPSTKSPIAAVNASNKSFFAMVQLFNAMWEQVSAIGCRRMKLRRKKRRQLFEVKDSVVTPSNFEKRRLVLRFHGPRKGDTRALGHVRQCA